MSTAVDSQSPLATGNVPRPAPHLGYRPELDGIRAVAISAVLAFHVSVHGLSGGFLGVDIFFVLSGCLITSLLIEEWDRTGTISFASFYARRALRLIPAVVALLAALWVAVLLLGDRTKIDAKVLGTTTLYTLGYVANWIRAFHLAPWPTAVNHLWSLAVEEQFYLVWPLILLGALSRGVLRRTLPLSLALGATVSALWRVWLWRHAQSYDRVYFATDTRADGLLLGCCVGALASAGVLPGKTVGRVLAAIATGVLLFVVATMDDTGRVYKFGFAEINVATAVLLWALLSGPIPILTRALSARPMIWIGRISYSLYLWHFPVFFFVQRFRHPLEAINPVIKLALAVACAALSHYVVEKPFLRYKQKLAGAQRQAADGRLVGRPI